jgi:hypothetical protein
MHVMRKVQEIKEGLKLNGTHQLVMQVILITGQGHRYHKTQKFYYSI